MKNICFFISSISETGGTGRVCTEIANKLSTSGYNVTILSMYGDKPFFDVAPAVRIVAVFSMKHYFKLFLPIVILRLRSKIKQINAEILFNVDSALFIYSFVSALGLRMQNVVWEHFNFYATLNAKVRIISRKLAAKYSNAIITLTDKDNGYWTSNLVCKAPVITINNPSPFPPQAGNIERSDVVLSAGRLTNQKGFDRLLDAWKVVSKAPIGNWQLHIVGSGELKEQLEQQIIASGLGSSVKLIPVTANIQQHYEQAAIYCMTSRFEGFPMVLLEAQSFGLPLVSYDCDTGPSEIINSNGILVADRDTAGMASALSELMNNKEQRLMMGKKSIENAYSYTIDIIINKWVTLIESL